MLAVEITGGAMEDVVRLVLYDLQGVFLQEIESAVGITRQIDIFAYPPATYILQLRIGNQAINYKIIKQ